MKSFWTINLFTAFIILLMGCDKDEQPDTPDTNTNTGTETTFEASKPSEAKLASGTWHVPNNLPLASEASVLVNNAMTWNDLPVVQLTRTGGAGASSTELKVFRNNTWEYLADGNYLMAKTAAGDLFGMKRTDAGTYTTVELAKLELGETEWKRLYIDTIPRDSFRFAYPMADGNDIYSITNFGHFDSPQTWVLRLSKWKENGWEVVNDDVLSSYRPFVAGNSVDVYHFGKKFVAKIGLYNPDTRKTDFVFFALNSGSLQEVFRYSEADALEIQLGKVLWANEQFYYAAIDQLYTLNGGQLTGFAKVEASHQWYWSDSDGEHIFLWTANEGSGAHIDIMNTEQKWLKLPATMDYTNTTHKFSMNRLYWLYKHMSFFKWNNQYVFVGTSDYTVDYSIGAFFQFE